jgi:hypothetical protein
MKISRESSENLDKIPELMVCAGVVATMKSDWDSQTRQRRAGFCLKSIKDPLVGSLLGLSLSGWISPVMSQTIAPQSNSTVKTLASVIQNTNGGSDRGERSLPTAVTRTTPSSESKLRQQQSQQQSQQKRQQNQTPNVADRTGNGHNRERQSVVTDRNHSQSHSQFHHRDHRNDNHQVATVPREPTHEQQHLNLNAHRQLTSQEGQFLTQTLDGTAHDSLDLNPDPLGQITSVSQLSDVKPTDWAFQALQSLVERYGCISGYPDLTYRGNRALTRYEFAAALNACWDQIDQLIQANRTDSPSPEDLQKLQQLYRDFQPEMATLDRQIEALEAETNQLAEEQFSTTTKLFGQAIFGLQGRTANEADFFPVDDEKDTKDPGTEINFINNVQLTLLTQLNSRSLILAGMQMGNGSTGPRLSNDTRLGYEGNTEQNIVLSDLNYRQLMSNRIAVIVGPAGVNMANVFRGVNPVESAGSGAVSALAQRNPILNIGNGRGGVGFDWQVNSRMSIQGVYSASTPGDVSNGGLFGGDDGQTTFGVQLTVTPINTVDVALNYVNAYSPFGVLGTGIGDDQLTVDSAIKTNGFGATVSWRVTPSITLGSWAGYTNSGIPGRDGDVETTNWMMFLNWENLFAQGNLGGIYIGQPPKIVDSNLPVGKNLPDLLTGGEGEPGGQPGTTTHVELFYRWEVSDQLSFTPGLLMIFEPGHTPASDPITVGVLRTTFNF